MRKVILGLAVSLDGYIEGPNGEFDWCFTDQDYGMSDFFNGVDTVFYGRKSYDLVSSMEGGEGQFPPMVTYIFSNTMQVPPEGATIINGNIKAAVDNIKKERGKDIWLFGGAQLIAEFMKLQLVDEFWLSIHPIILGSGKPLFPQTSERTWLELLETKTYETGLVSVKYRVKHTT